MKNHTIFLYFLLLVVCTSSFSFKTNSAVENYDLGGWAKLGKQTVGQGVSHDELILTEEKTSIKRLKLKVQKTSVYIMSITVRYDDGTSEDHRISRRLEKGDSSRPLDLIGHYRTIQKIIFVYRGNSNKGGAELVVLGKK